MFVQLIDFPDYMVNDAGVVVSLKQGKAKTLKPILSKRGYYVVQLYKNKKARICYVHRLVASAFFGSSSLDVNHKDGVKTNNNLSNLEFVTTQKNILHAFETGLCNSFVGEKNNLAKLSNEQTNQLKLLKGKITQNEAAARFNVSQPNVSMIWSGKSRKYA